MLYPDSLAVMRVSELVKLMAKIAKLESEVEGLTNEPLYDWRST